MASTLIAKFVLSITIASNILVVFGDLQVTKSAIHRKESQNNNYELTLKQIANSLLKTMYNILKAVFIMNMGFSVAAFAILVVDYTCKERFIIFDYEYDGNVCKTIKFKNSAVLDFQ